MVIRIMSSRSISSQRYRHIILNHCVYRLQDTLLCNCCGCGCFPVNVWGCADLFCSSTSHTTSTTIPNCFLLIHSIVHAIVDDIGLPSVFCRMYQKYLGLEILQNTENEANLLLPLGIQRLKGVGEASPPDPLTPVIGSRSARSP